MASHVHVLPLTAEALDYLDSLSCVTVLVKDHDVYKKRLRADGTPIDEGTKHEIGPENIDESSSIKTTENGTVCGSCYGAQTAKQECCNTCDEVIKCMADHVPCKQAILG